MAFEAKLTIHDKTYDLVECEYEFYQSVDEGGRPSSRTQCGLIKFVMPAPGDDDLFFYKWMFDKTKTQSGSIKMILSTDKQVQKYKTLHFINGYLVNLYEYFNNNNSLLVRTKITISAEIMGFGVTGTEAVFRNEWTE